MLQRKYRLKKYSAFIATYRLNNAVADKNICVYFGKKRTEEAKNVKVGFVVSKKIHKRAVVRNHIKRLMRENFRQLLKKEEYSFLNDYLSIICVAKKGMLEANYNDTTKTLNNLLNKKREA